MVNDKVKILFLATNNPGVVFYRMYQFANKLSQLGLAHCKMFPDWNPRDMLMKDWEQEYENVIPVIEPLVTWADVVICQYIHSAKGLSLVEAMRDLKPTFIEIDDYCAQVPHQSLAYDSNMPGYAQDIWATRQMIESKGVITTTEWLRNQYLKWNRNIAVIPNCIDLELWDQYKSSKHDRIRIGWIGGDNHDGDLKIVKDVLFEILKKYENSEVFIICGNPPDWGNIERLNLISRWEIITDYPKMVKDYSFDIGIAPLRDHYFNRAKSNLKYLEYSACKIPTIASNVEPFKNNFNGIVCNTDEEWFEAISNLIDNEDLRLLMGWEGYQEIKEKFNLDIITRQYVDFLKEQIKWHGQISQGQAQAMAH